MWVVYFLPPLSPPPPVSIALRLLPNPFSFAGLSFSAVTTDDPPALLTLLPDGLLLLAPPTVEFLGVITLWLGLPEIVLVDESRSLDASETVSDARAAMEGVPPVPEVVKEEAEEAILGLSKMGSSPILGVEEKVCWRTTDLGCLTLGGRGGFGLRKMSSEVDWNNARQKQGKRQSEKGVQR